MRLLKRIGTSLLAMTLATGIVTAATDASAQQKKFKIYLSMSYSGNAWQTETSNLVKAMAATPPYDKLVDLKVVISGIDPQAQASAYESMVSNGADAIISFPISATALNRAIRRGCKKGVLFVNYSGTVTSLVPTTSATSPRASPRTPRRRWSTC